MAKFRQGNLILNSDEKVIQGGNTVIDSGRAVIFGTLRGSSGTSITNISTNTSLGISDNAVSTQNAVKTYVDSKISGSIGPGSVNEIAVYDTSNGIKTSSTLISTDGTFAANSDTKIPTEKATKTYVTTYVDAKVAGTIATGTDRAVAVYDGTSNIVASGVSVDASGNTNIGGVLSISGETKADGAFYAGDTAPDSTTRLNYNGYFYSTKSFNSVWNDYADFQKVVDKQIPGLCYYDTLNGAKRCTEYCQKSVIGIISDTYGHAVGIRGKLYAPFAIAGWALAYIDDDAVPKLEPGDALTSSSTGRLTKMLRKDAKAYPDRIVAIYKKPEKAKFWGPEGGQVKVRGRHWVKVK